VSDQQPFVTIGALALTLEGFYDEAAFKARHSTQRKEIHRLLGLNELLVAHDLPPLVHALEWIAAYGSGQVALVAERALAGVFDQPEP
jgi:hypothetical protein